MSLGPEAADSAPSVGAEAGSHAFVIRLWQEEAADVGRRQLWRGHITHLPGGERRYLFHLDDVVAFMTVYVPAADVGARGGFLYRAWLGLKQGRHGTSRRS
jgi:hypothetical protein